MADNSTFVVLSTFDRAALAMLVDKKQANLDPVVRKLARAAGAEIQDLWFTTGDYDMVTVVEAPNAQAALAFLVAFADIGGVNSRTLNVAKAGKVIDDARDLHTKMMADDSG